MLSSFKNMFRIADLRNKILFTLLIIAIYRIGSHIPIPGVNLEALRQMREQAQSQGVVAFLDLFSGGALTNLSVFSLGIMPYITASIIMQLMTVVIPKVEQWRDQGELGQRKITQWTRYVTVGLALMQSTGILFLAHNGQLFTSTTPQQVQADLVPVWNVGRVALMVMTMTAGTALIMWLGELISQRGIGNGMSLLIFVSVISRLPYQGTGVYKTGGAVKFTVLLVVLFGILAAIIFIDQGQEKIPIHFSKRLVGRRVYGGTTTYLPVKVNNAGVIPIIFASSVLYLPSLLATTLPFQGFTDFVNRHLISSTSIWYMTLYFLLIVGFTYFYTAIQFDPEKQADSVKKQGGFIPGIRPGRPTAEFLDRVLTRITFPGALYLGLVALLPTVLFAIWRLGNEFEFGGTSMLIVVGVALETMKQIDSQLTMRNYEGFIR
jgi:preprotein translocase subunit SecY